MSRNSEQRFDVLVIGGGPAGIAAAVCAAECGANVGIVDDNLILGGQIWRGGSKNESGSEAARWLERLKAAGVTAFCGRRVVHQPEIGTLLAEGADDQDELRYRSLILATGARERFLPFPGWTLPNVMGVGALQAMVKSGLPIHGKRVVVVGTGPLLLAVAAYLRRHGAQIPIVCDQASWSRLAWFAVSLIGQPAKVLQGFQLKSELAGIPFIANSWPLAAYGWQILEGVTISRAGKAEDISCDYLACGFHLVPNVELPLLLGCQLHRGYVQVDDLQQTTVSGIFCAGEPTSIGGEALSLLEGQIAGFAAVGRPVDARRLLGKRERARRFARMLERTFRLRPELRHLVTPETLVCRCEDVPYSRLQQHASWRAAKLHTRCGMGPCQGRICGSAAQFLFDWSPDSVRPPVFPARVETLAALDGRPEPELTPVGGHIQ